MVFLKLYVGLKEIKKGATIFFQKKYKGANFFRLRNWGEDKPFPKTGLDAR